MEEYIPFLRFNSADYSLQTVIAVCAVMLLGGMIALLYGYRVYRVVAVVATALAGAYVGWFFLAGLLPEKVAWLAPVALGLIGAVGAIAMQKLMIFLAGAAVGFISLGPVVAEAIWNGETGPTSTQYLLCGAAAFLVMGLLALILFKPITVVATSMFGSSLVLSSIVHLVEALSQKHQGLYQAYPKELAWTFVGVALVGTIFQAATRKRGKLKA